jgi:HKD family nuclease
MQSRLVTSGLPDTVFKKKLLRGLRDSRPASVGLAVAYVSVYGASFLKEAREDVGIEIIRLVADIGDRITHPKALRLALAEGWAVRVSNPARGTFHPKMIVGGAAFNDTDELQQVKLSVIGSANLSRGGLRNNVECSLIRISDVHQPAASQGFKRLWNVGADLTEAMLDRYEADFEERNRQRSSADMRVLGVADNPEALAADNAALRAMRPPGGADRSIAVSFAKTGWAGLESFTGEYQFQVEFPRDAGNVLNRMILATGAGAQAHVRCDDGAVRLMRFRYYADNSMFRLNIPNETPNVEWARANRQGVAVLETIEGVGDQLRLRIIKPGRDAQEVTRKSVALGTWGKTSTRLYGWY